MQNLGDASTPHTGSILYGTVHGALGLVTQVPQDFYEFLKDIQRRLCAAIRSVGRIDHEQWRSFYNERKTEPMEVRGIEDNWANDVPIRCGFDLLLMRKFSPIWRLTKKKLQ